MTSALVDLTPYLAAGWDTPGVLGYYIHQGYVYLDGLVVSAPGFNSSEIVATPTILAAIPALLRPASSVAFTLHIDAQYTDETRDPALELATSYAATLDTDGNLTLDEAVPSQLNTAPDVADYYCIDPGTGTPVPRYPRPMILGLVLGDLRWPSRGTPPADTYASQSFAPYLVDGDFEDVDSTYAIHGTRVHLGGSVRAVVDGAQELATFLPPDAGDGLQSDESDYTQADDRGLNVYFYGAFFDGDPLIKPADEPPPVAYWTPQLQPTRHFAGSQPYPWYQNWTSIPSTLYHGSPTLDEYGYGIPFGTEPRDTCDFGSYVCDGVDGEQTLAQGGVIGSTLTFNIGRPLAICDPAPDWFALEIYFTIEPFVNAEACAPGFPNVPANLQLVSLVVGDQDASYEFLQLADGTTVQPWDDSGGGIAAWLAPASSLYTGETGMEWMPGNLGGPSLPGGLLWQAGQITGEISLTYSAYVNRMATLSAYCVMTPLWERRQIGFHAGDIIDLDGSGWVGTGSYIVPLLPGVGYPGSIARGTIRSCKNSRFVQVERVSGGQITGPSSEG